jgi:hypothetical protein
VSTPHRCPICLGRGMVDFDPDLPGVGTATGPRPCKPCSGTGIVWEGDRVSFVPSCWTEEFIAPGGYTRVSLTPDAGGSFLPAFTTDTEVSE